MAGYQAQTAQVLQEMFSRFNMVEHIPTLTEMCSKMLVISAEQNFETSNPKKGQPKQKKYPFFSKEHKSAFKEHEKVCRGGGKKVIQMDFKHVSAKL